jgi:hypothetical protein
MRRLSRDVWMLIGLALLLALMTGLAAINQTESQSEPPLYIDSEQPDGARALALWLDDIGYQVDESLLNVFKLPEEADLVLLLQPTTVLTTAELDQLEAWVEEGGNLVIAGNNAATALAARHFDFDLSFLRQRAEALAPQNPLFESPTVQNLPSVETQSGWRTERDDYVVHFASGETPVLVSFEHGNGRILLISAPFPLSNSGLKEEGNPELVLNILSAVDGPGVVWFDEWHHGLRTGGPDVSGPIDWLRLTPAGRAILYTSVVVFVALALGGRAFGRPVPLPKDSARRAPVEYITALANLNRRAGHRKSVMADYHHRLKRGLGNRYRLDPTLEDDDFVARLLNYNPTLNATALRELLVSLRQQKVSESELIELAAEVAQWSKES